MEKIKQLVKNYKAKTNRQKQDKATFIWCLENMDNLLTRENEQFHITSTGVVTNKQYDKILLVFHNIYNAWTLPGGHSDGEENLAKVAEKEIGEETGISKLELLNKGQPISIEKLLVDQHYKHNKLVFEHYHLNFTFLFCADDSITLTSKADENSGAKWFTLEDFLYINQSDLLIEQYKEFVKIIQKLKRN